MGNTVITNTGILKTGEFELEKTDLGKFIKEWANIYQVSNNLDQNIFRDTLKKRACCTKQANIPIGIAGIANIDGEDKIVNYAVNVPIFGSITDITNETCNLSDGDGRKQSYLGVKYGEKVASGLDTCKTFYTNFGAEVIKNRSIHTNIGHKLYGINDDEDDKHMSNPFKDCNCLNGIYQQKNLIASKPGTPSVDSWQAEQTIDDRCTTLANLTYKPYIKDDAQICMNIINAAFIEATKGGSIKINQSCQTQQAQEDQQARDAGADTLQKTPASEVKLPKEETLKKTDKITKTGSSSANIETTNNSIAKSFNMMLIYSGIGLLICIILIIIFFMLSGSKSQSIE